MAVPKDGVASLAYGRPKDGVASLAHGRPKDGVASLAYGRPKDGVASLAYGRPKDGVASLAYGRPKDGVASLALWPSKGRRRFARLWPSKGRRRFARLWPSKGRRRFARLWPSKGRRRFRSLMCRSFCGHWAISRRTMDGWGHGRASEKTANRKSSAGSAASATPCLALLQKLVNTGPSRQPRQARGDASAAISVNFWVSTAFRPRLRRTKHFGDAITAHRRPGFTTIGQSGRSC